MARCTTRRASRRSSPTCPGLKVVVPSTPYDARGLLRSSIRDDDPVLFFEHKKMYRSVRGDVPDTDYVVPLGKAAVTHPGTQITVIAYGLMAHYALEAADRVAEDGISVEVVDLRTLRPLDNETVLDSVRKTGKCLIVYEDNRFGGYGAEVAAIVAEEAFDYLDGPVTRIAGPDVPGVPVQPRARGLVHGQPREDRGRHPQARGVLRKHASTEGDPVGQAEFDELFQRLRSMLEPYGTKMHVSANSEQWYGVDMAPEGERDPSTWFGATRLGKRYVSYYLMPVYVQPALVDDISPALRKRMQGKSCFNFARVDEPLLAELETLTKRGYEATAGDPAWGAARRAEGSHRPRRA